MFQPELVQGIIAGGEAALARATEATEDDPEMGKRDLLARGFHRRRRPGRDRGQRPDALRAGRGRGGTEVGRADGRNQLHAGFGAGRALWTSRSRRWRARK